jgi:hypothetical protein
MVIAREAGYINKKTEIRACLGISVLFVVGATHRNDHDIYKLLLFAACKFFSEHAMRKAIWPLDKQEDITNMR